MGFGFYTYFAVSNKKKNYTKISLMGYRRNEHFDHKPNLICILYMKFGFILGLIDLPCPAYCNEILFLKSLIV